jgi:nucleoside 2-deoxyribosyltransferase
MTDVYLAGPIAGLSYGDAVAWRAQAKRAFENAGITAYSPMRAKEALAGMGPLAGAWESPSYDPLSPHSVFKRDMADIYRADVILANLAGAEKVSIGTMIELGVAHQLQIPIVVVLRPADIHWHIFVLEVATRVCPTIEDAITWIGNVFDQ